MAAALKSFFKDTVIYGLAIVLPRVINFLLVNLYTDVLPNEDYSTSTEVYAIIAFLNVLLAYGLETSFFRFFSQAKEKEKVVSTALIMIISSTIVIGTLLFLFRVQCANVLGVSLTFYKLLLAITLIEAFIVIPFAYLRVVGRPVRFAIIKLINVFVIVALNVLLLSKTYGVPSLQNLFSVQVTVEYIFIANLIASIIVLLLVSPYFFKYKLSFDRNISLKLLKYGWPIMIAGFAFVINDNLDKWLLPRLEGRFVNGAYSACYKLAVFMTLFIQAFKMGAEPFFYNHAHQKNAKITYAVILKYFVIIGSLGLLVITVFIDVLSTMFISNDSYLLAINIVPIVLLANLCLGIYHNLSIWYKLTDNTQYGMYISVFGALVTIVFNLVFIPKIGFMAAAYATLLAYAIMMISSYLIGKKQYKVPYQVNRIMLYLLVAVAFSFLNFYAFGRHMVLGIIFILIFLSLIYILERKEIKNLVNQ